jgi:NADH-quinone oxidoreductase subunit D
LVVDGEVVVAGTARLGYAHRGIEKAVESRTWVQNLYLLERVCGICSHAHAMTYCLGVEALANVAAPPRAQAMRTLVAELERLHSHLLWLGVVGHDAGFEALFMYSWRDREAVMDVMEMLTGNRVNYSINVLGGVKVDLDGELSKEIAHKVDFIERRAQHYLETVAQDMLFLRRTRGIAILSADQAIRAGVVGPTGRASGVARDVRLDAPYAGYGAYVPRLITATNGDLEARFTVRLQETVESCRLIRDILDSLPPGDLAARMPRRIPAGEVISRIEAPRGELLYFIKSMGGDTPERIKVRTPTMCNLGSVLEVVVGHQLADVPLILAGVDPCFSCNDRTLVIQRENV